MENKRKISAKIVADSIDPRGNRITTFVLTYPRFIHAELLTHRLFSRNAASSRAIPFKKMVEMVKSDPFIPIAWQFDHKGMQGIEYVTEESDFGGISARNESWLSARDCAIQQAEDLNSMDTTKQLCNRLLEPFMWYTVLVTATEFDNFYELRAPKYKIFSENMPIYFKSRKDLNKYVEAVGDAPFKLSEEEWWMQSESGAEIHIQALAEAMWDAQNESTPKALKAGEWHIPFGDRIVEDDLLPILYKINTAPGEMAFQKVKIATARCARLSYMTFDGEIDYEKDIKLHDQLLESKHYSPFEHCCRVMSVKEYYSYFKGVIPTQVDKYGITNLEMMPYSSGDPIVGFKGYNPNNGDRYGWCNNVKGYIQYRYLVENGNS